MSLRAQWTKFVAVVGLDRAPDRQLTEMQKAFYAGAFSMFQEMTGLTADSPSDDVGAARIDALHAELEAFYANLREAAHQ
jgi:hypothetical protein